MTLHIRWAALLLILGLSLRLIAAASAPAVTGYDDRSGDSGWYLLNGLALAGGSVPVGYGVEISNLQPPPGYLLFVGFAQRLLPLPDAVSLIRVVQALLSTLTCYLAYRIGERLGGERAAVLTLAIFALSPALAVEAAQVTSETLYLCLLAGALAAYITALDDDTRPQVRMLVLAGVLFGLATLTRAALLLFPIGLAVHLLLVYRSRRVLPAVAALWVFFALTVSTWTVYSLARWDRWVIAGEGFASFIYLGASGWAGPREVDQGIQQDITQGQTFESRQDQYLNAAGNVIMRDLPGYIKRRLGELAGAYLQPHGTTYYPGPSLRDLAVRWLTQERSPSGIIHLTQSEGFWPKLLLYVVHFATLLFGLLGMWVTRRRWRLTLPLIGLVIYVTLLHLVLLALPRYILPTLIAWYVFTALWWARRGEPASASA